jgi:predicted alpha/beta-fold hydrolase
LENFNPYPFIKNGWAQTITSSYIPTGRDKAPKDYHEICLGDGDRLMVAENTPAGWRNGDKIIAIVHGLSGHYQSFYMIRQAKYFMSLGYKVVRINLRGCGPGLEIAKEIYHAGRSLDTLHVMQWIHRHYPDSPIVQIGFSLGGNITLKMMGEYAEQLPETMIGSAAVSSPILLDECSDHVHENRLFELYFLTHMRFEVRQRQKMHPDLEFPELPLIIKSLRHFDDTFTGPILGFKNGQEYYDYASCKYHLDKITKPTLIVGSKDDPIADVFNYHKIPNKPNIHVKLTDEGGHVGFLGSKNKIRPSFWIDDYLHRWVENL